jgi:AraC-like DNA-binding protein
LTYAAVCALQPLRVPGFIWLLPAGTAAVVHVCLVWVRSPLARASSAEAALLARMIVFAVGLDAAQAIRTFWPQVTAFREIVPITMMAGFLSVAALAMRQFLKRHAEDGAARPPQYAKSGLDATSAHLVLAELDRGMRDAGWYRDPQLSLASLAAKLAARPHVLSQALNQQHGRTLNEYLAVWRVAEARRLLADPASDRYTIDALAEAAGFASRSAFYKAFKAHEGMTPTAFRARVRASMQRSAVS